MKILLCTPYNLGSQFVQGGIVVWAQNIVGYYNRQSTDVLVPPSVWPKTLFYYEWQN